MKRFLLFSFIFFAGVSPAKTQPLPDSIRSAYKNARSVQDKRRLLSNYINFIRSSDEFFATTAAIINYLRSENDHETADFLQLPVNDQLAKTGNYITALSSCLELLNSFEKRKDTQGILMAYRTLSTTYYYAGDKIRDVEYGKKAAAIAKKMGNFTALSSIYNNLSTSYAQNKVADSAVGYALEAVACARKSKDPYAMGSVLGTLGEAYILQKKYDSAIFYVRKSLSLPGSYDVLGRVWNLNDLAQIYLEKNIYDSSRFYAHQALALSKTNRFIDQLQRSYEYLSRSFEKTNNTDSAFNYLKLASVIKDSLYTSKKNNQVQGITSREQARQEEILKAGVELRNKVKIYSLLCGLVILCTIAFIFYRNNRQKQKANKVLESTLENLRSTQKQLVQSEKMASLGELTAGIAHEIQNPLNFVNNFSDINRELLEELKDEADKGNLAEVKIIASDVISNEQKINHHGKRADAIVKGMLQHSRSSNGVKEPTDINALCDEYLRLSYHGLRAKDKSFNATIKSDFDNSIQKATIIPQDLGRVILNLLTNAFYAVNEKKKSGIDPYEPTVSISTKKAGNKIIISVTDNGNGIPQNIADKIFQPFFTTKPTGQGTGLGLSLSYDIVTKGHDGQLSVDTREGEGTTFTIELPVV